MMAVGTMKKGGQIWDWTGGKGATHDEVWVFGALDEGHDRAELSVTGQLHAGPMCFHC